MLNQQVLVQQEIVDLVQEIKLLRSALFGYVGKDPEGEYNPIFVNQLLENAKEKDAHEFKNKKDFLNLLNK